MSLRTRWVRDELILALDLYHRVTGLVPETHDEVVALSVTLRSLPFAPGLIADARYRSPAAVHLKLQNFLAIDPAFDRTAMSHGSQGDRAVFSEFEGRTGALALLAGAIREAARMERFEEPTDEDETEFPEGRILFRLHRRRERSVALVRRARERHLRVFGRLYCEVCGFDGQAVYGVDARVGIEVHLNIPISELLPGARTRVRDLSLVCANCHRTIHHSRPWMTIQALRKIVCNRRALAQSDTGSP